MPRVRAEPRDSSSATLQLEALDDEMVGVVRRFARDLWVRSHGTPRVTVLAGDDHAKQLWQAWLNVVDRSGALYDGELDFDRAIRDAVAYATATPDEPVAVIARPATIATWRARRTDRLAAMVDEGLVAVPPRARARGRGAPRAPARGQRSDSREVTPSPDTARGHGAQPAARDRGARPSPLANLDARSAAEAALFEALEATPATRGRFRLNESLSVRFGSRAAEVDLLSRGDRIAIEIDGVHHFSDPACYRRDREKDLLLQQQGLLVIRLLAEDVLRDPRDGVQMVCRALACRMKRTDDDRR